MSLVAIGVPVYNGADQIEECLDCLTRQTLRDIEIIVSDNASTDNTGEIVRAYAKRDPRIKYILQPVNLGLMGNFRAVVEAAQSPYFTLRCHDDLSSQNYLKALLEALQHNAGKKLAAPMIETYRNEKLVRTKSTPKNLSSFEIVAVYKLMFNSHAPWFCGLWNLDAFRPVFNAVWDVYDSPWGPDHLTLYPFLLDRSVVFASDAVFIQRITPKKGAGRYLQPDMLQGQELRHSFLMLCDKFRRERNIQGVKELALKFMTWLYVGKRVYKARTLLRKWLLGRS